MDVIYNFVHVILCILRINIFFISAATFGTMGAYMKAKTNGVDPLPPICQPGNLSPQSFRLHGERHPPCQFTNHPPFRIPWIPPPRVFCFRQSFICAILFCLWILSQDMRDGMARENRCRRTEGFEKRSSEKLTVDGAERIVVTSFGAFQL